MKCPKCQSCESKVIESRDVAGGDSIRRRRECEQCSSRFTTYERLERPHLTVVKKGGVRELFDRGKVSAGIERASEKTTITAPQREEMRQALQYLWGEGVGAAQPPTPQHYQEGDMPQSVRLAVASNTSENLDGHFGSAKRFLVYQVSQTEARLIEIRDPSGCEDTEDANSARAQMLADCQLLYVQSIGGPAAAKVIRAGIHPVKFPLGGPALASIERLQQTLQAPPPWLARIMGITPHSLARFIVEEDEAA